MRLLFTNQRILRVAIFTALTGLLGAGNVAAVEPKEMVGMEIYTLTNLHPDEKNMRLYSTNYQLPPRIKVCTKVDIKKVSKKKMLFEIADSGKKYTYLYHRTSTPEGFYENIKKYFGPECPAAEIEAMSDADKEGIKKSRGKVGMTRRGIIIAMGYPPEHVTHELDYDEWIYWANKWTKDAVVFGQDGKVTEMRD